MLPAKPGSSVKLHRSISTDELTAVGRVLAGLPPEKRAALEELTIRGERVDLEAAEAAYHHQTKGKSPAALNRAPPSQSPRSGESWAAPVLRALTHAVLGGTSAYCGHDSPVELIFRGGEKLTGNVPVVHRGWSQTFGSINVALDLSTYCPLFGFASRPIAAVLAGVLAGLSGAAGATDQAASLKRLMIRQAKLSFPSMGGPLSDATVTPIALIDSQRDLRRLSASLGPIAPETLMQPAEPEAHPGFAGVTREFQILKLGRAMMKAADAVDPATIPLHPERWEQHELVLSPRSSDWPAQASGKKLKAR